jgi:hypothetical protein
LEIIQELLGHNSFYVEFGRRNDGQKAIAIVPISQLIDGFRGDLLNFLKPECHDLKTRPAQLFHQVIEPERLFDFARFARLFGHRFVPFQFAHRSYESIFFSPMDLDRLGNP